MPVAQHVLCAVLGNMKLLEEHVPVLQARGFLGATEYAVSSGMVTSALKAGGLVMLSGPIIHVAPSSTAI